LGAGVETKENRVNSFDGMVADSSGKIKTVKFSGFDEEN
jgi:hypothetical protein